MGNIPKMVFGDLKSKGGVTELDEHLSTRSYIEGFEPTLADTAVFEALSGIPGTEYPHARRWYRHIESFGPGRKSFPVAKDSYMNSIRVNGPSEIAKGGGGGGKTMGKSGGSKGAEVSSCNVSLPCYSLFVMGHAAC